MKSKNINNLSLGIIFTAISIVISYLLISKKIMVFIHPRMIKFFIAGLIFIIILALTQFIAFFKSTHKENFRYAAFLFIMPFAFGMCINVSNISSNISKNKNVALTQNAADSSKKSDDKNHNDFLSMDVINITEDNYYKVMDAISANMNAYKGKKISVKGFVYRTPNIKHDEFVAARMLIVCCTADAQIIGFLCKNQSAQNFKDNEWVAITGTIDIDEISDQSGKNKTKCPVIISSKIEKIEKPINQYIYPQY